MTGFKTIIGSLNWLDYLKVDNIFVNLEAKDKLEAISRLVELMAANSDVILNKDEYLNAVLEREALGSTGLGDFIAMPHGKCSSVKTLSIGLAKLACPIDFDSIDKKPVEIIFLIASPPNIDTLYIKVMASIIRSVKTYNIHSKIKDLNNPTLIYEMLINTITS